MNDQQNDPLMNAMIFGLRQAISNKSDAEAIELLADQIRRALHEINSVSELNPTQTSAMLIAVANVFMLQEVARAMSGTGSTIQ